MKMNSININAQIMCTNMIKFGLSSYYILRSS